MQSAQTEPFPGLDPEAAGLLRDGAEADRLYSFRFCGHCLGDWLRDGSDLIADPALDLRPLDIVNIVLRRDCAGPWGAFVNNFGQGFMGVCKVFLGGYETASGKRIYVVAQTAPPAVSPIPASAIKAMHRVIIPSSLVASMSDDDRESVGLITPFICVREAIPPVNPEWKPEPEDILQWA